MADKDARPISIFQTQQTENNFSIECELSPGIDPDKWAKLSMGLGRLEPMDFYAIFDRFFSEFGEYQPE